MDELRRTFEQARSDGLARIEEAEDLAGLEEARVRVLGRKSALSTARGGLGSLNEDDRKAIGALANEVQRQIESAIEAKRDTFEAGEKERRWASERIDVTLPGRDVEVGSVHPLTKTIWEIVDIFIGLGYEVAEGPEVELNTYNFDALNTPPAHPARSEQDTFYVAGTDDQVCLRTQTSPMQMRLMEAQSPPLYVVMPGRVYRREDQDATHLAQFAQLEGLAVDEHITMGDLKGTLMTFAARVFGKDLDVRMRPHYFPFTEPSAELDVQCFVCRGNDPACRLCKGEGWIEVLGCGMVDPFLYEWVGYEPDKWTGFAFGMGIERIAALAHGVPDIRAFYENDTRFLRQFGAIT
ncbi:MAG: phenylalanyl-tRNA synthetase alpha chain [Actinomycetota bacterium]|jgi:phenylalanyl-tRNA synthetase alpha chain|nr:phenylalanyl-tRNA synthetase alpha chain [Actinomycetota bacterium]